MPSIFTRILNKEIPGYIVDQDDDHFAILDINPINPGHILVIPNRETDDLFDLEPVAYSKIFVYARRVATALKKAVGAKRIGMAVEGFSVAHCHVHLVPVNNVNELDPKRAKRATVEELQAMWGKIQCLGFDRHEIERTYVTPETAKRIGKLHITSCRRCRKELADK